MTRPAVSIHLLLGGTLGLLLSAAPAAVLAQYAFSGAPATLIVTTVNAAVTASSIDFTNGADSQFVSVPNILAVNTPAGALSAATAIGTNSFFEFTVTPKPGFALDLSSLTFDAAYASAGAGYAIRTSADGYLSTVATANIATSYPSFGPVTVSLASPSFQGLLAPFTVRVYSYTPATSPAAGYDNLTLNGLPITVPEPSALLALGVSGILLAKRRRCRRFC
jgi:hypothetical protein